ncbi:hypothetical protein AN640_04450 [Candidatus Epulonipiscium fishelsonii]|uniref:Uncharacterized protein n=1 Tax=Candidatus Epulonipiscium fishelsonii TaxID=77094 RepID=A0ACC8XIZ8_9FIRM|nr:hypothetical protein AN640_04450 [Epulopiscium sp. SCG-D08WGA-EpuloA1]OON96280.1 MAG: hypothetical protein ATN32_06530 [Epulopiscium sp. AS2M-Bin002]
MKIIKSILLLICLGTNVLATEYITSSWKLSDIQSAQENINPIIVTSKLTQENINPIIKSKGDTSEIKKTFSDVNNVLSKTKSVDLPFEYSAMPYDYDPQEERILREKLSNLERYSQGAFGTDVYRTINVPYFPQENGYYCGPATIKQVMHYFNGTSYEQSDIANSLYTNTSGTDMTYLHKYLNIVTDEQYIYYEKATADFYEWLDIIIYNIMNNKPVILDVTIRERGAFPYTTAGHFLNISGVDTKNRRLRLTDPSSIHGGNVWYDWNDVYDANHAHFRQAIIW